MPKFPGTFYRWRPHPWHGLEVGPEPPRRVHAFIEICPFDLVKYEVDKTTGYLRVDRPQRSSSQHPTLYGFIPRTYCGPLVGQLMPEAIRGDGDPLDICVLTERPITRSEILRTYTALFDWRSGYIVVILSVAVLAFFIFAWDKATGLSAEERREVGILKALGWDTSDILIMKFWEGSAISLTTFLVGVILAYVHVYFASATLFEHALKGWSVLYPTFTLRPTVNAFEIATLFFLTVAPYSLITIIPTWSVAVSDPDAVMRQ